MRCASRLLCASSLATLLLGVAASFAQPPKPGQPAPAKPEALSLNVPPEDAPHVHLSVDGNLAGRVVTFDDAGTCRCCQRVDIAFARRGQLVAKVRSDEWGRFQVVGIQPNVYSVLVACPEGFAVTAVQVAPFEAPDKTPTPAAAPTIHRQASYAAAEMQMPLALLSVSLAPTADVALFSSMLGGLAPVAPAAAAAAAPQAAAAAAAGGAGGGLGGMLGAAGAGLGVGGAAGGGGGGGGVASDPTPAGTGTPSP